MHRFEAIISVLDRALGTKRKRHLAAGILSSVSLLCGALALTIMTLQSEEDNEQKYIE